MGQNKLERFAAIAEFPNVLEYPEEMKGHWNQHFGNDHPITLELACGKGEMTTGLGARHPAHNFIGVDLKGNRMYIGARLALRESLGNIAFLRTQIQMIDRYFAPGEVADIWIMFPDPFLRASKAGKRLTHPRFLALYQKILKPGGLVRLKTDSRELFDFTLESIMETGCEIVEQLEDIYGNDTAEGPLAIQTFYEQSHLANGRLINFVSFRLPATPIVIPPKKRPADESAERR